MGSRRRPKYVPHQSKISVQDIRDAATPQGSAMLNEELRRIALTANEAAKSIEELKAAQIPPADITLGGVSGGGGSRRPVEITARLQLYEDGFAKGNESTQDIDFAFRSKDGAIPVKFQVEVRGDTLREVTGYVTLPETGLQIEEQRRPVGGKDTEYLNFLFGNDTSPTPKPAGYTVPILFDISDDSNKRRSVRAYTLAVTEYTFDLSQANEENANEEVYSVPSTSKLKYLNATEAKPTGYGDRIWFDVIQVSATEFKLLGYYDGTGGSSGWIADGDTGTTENVSSGETVFITGSQGVSVNVGPSGANTAVQISYSGWWLRQSNEQNVNNESYNILGSGVVDLVNETESKPAGYTKRVWADIAGAGPYTVKLWYEDLSASYTWIGSDGSVNAVISDGETVTFLGSNAVSVTLAGNTFTISRPLKAEQSHDTALIDFTSTLDTTTLRFENATITAPVDYTQRVFFTVAQPSAGVVNIEGLVSGAIYSWTIEDSDESAEISSGEIVRFLGDDGVTTELTPGSPNVLTISRPLTWKQSQDEDTAIFTSSNDILSVIAENATAQKPLSYTKRIFFNITEPVPGTVKMEAWYEDEAGAGSYSWWLGTNGETPGVEVTDGALVDFSPGDLTVVISRTGYDVTLSSPLTLLDDGVAIGGSDTIEINFDSNGQTSTAVPVRFDLTNNANGRRTVRAYVPVGGYNWNLWVNSAFRESIDSGEEVDFVAGSNISLTGANRQVVVNSTYSYSWTVKAPQSDAGATVGNNTAVIFQGLGSITTSRTGNTVYINDSSETPSGGTAKGRRVKMGFLEWGANGAPPTGYYGNKKYADIVHNWNLINMHTYTLELRDVVSNDGMSTINYYRRATTPAGDIKTKRFRLRPYPVAVNGNTIRVWITQSMVALDGQGNPVGAKMFYVLREV